MCVCVYIYIYIYIWLLHKRKHIEYKMYCVTLNKLYVFKRES